MTIIYKVPGQENHVEVLPGLAGYEVAITCNFRLDLGELSQVGYAFKITAAGVDGQAFKGVTCVGDFAGNVDCQEHLDQLLSGLSDWKYLARDPQDEFGRNVLDIIDILIQRVRKDAAGKGLRVA